ncbi:MAG: TetR family transcriptional regulator [Pseudomonadota bacterium]|nr:TetR family transcriptional regulator [Pseudomonadota bacterium]
MEPSRQRFLDAADRIFVENGYRGTTIRAVCADAGTSLAILHRNWPGKEALFTEVFRRHFDPLHAAQAERFAALDDNPCTEAILCAFFEPAFERLSADRRGLSVYSRALTDPSREARGIVALLIGDTRRQLIALLRNTVPHVDETRFYIMMNLVMGVFVYPQAFSHQLAVAMAFDDSALDWSDAAKAMARMVATALTT